MRRAIEVLAWLTVFVCAGAVYLAGTLVAWPILRIAAGIAWIQGMADALMRRALDVFAGGGLRTPKVEVWRGMDWGVGQGPGSEEYRQRQERENARAARLVEAANAELAGKADLGTYIWRGPPPERES
jgi:hypothetical protein